MFKNPPEIVFTPQTNECIECNRELNIYKTKKRTVFTHHIGEFTTKETQLICSNTACNNKIVYHSEELPELVAAGCNYGHDIVELVGVSMYMKHMQAVEIKELLRCSNNIPISVSGVEFLAKKFIIYLSVVHEQYNVEIVNEINTNGGYILHLDALDGGAKGGMRLMCGVDGITDFVLGNEKISSENSYYIIPFLERLKKDFGSPLRIVQDCGTGIMKAAETVFPEVEILVCHFHFLRDIGKDLLSDDYDIIRKRLRHFGILTELRKLSEKLTELCSEENDIGSFYTSAIQNESINIDNHAQTALLFYTLIQWILDWKSECGGYGFPFDRPHLELVKRVGKALDILEKNEMIKDIDPDNKRIIRKAYFSLKRILEGIVKDKKIKNALRGIEKDITVFDNLRTAMRVASEKGKEGLNDEGEQNIRLIETSVKEFVDKLEKDQPFCDEKKGSAFLEQIYKYWDKLFADPIVIETGSGTKTIQPQRTNNIMEQMFRNLTRDYKRKTGDSSVGRTVQAMVKDTPFIRNLKNEKYKKIILGDKKSLAEVFAEIDPVVVRRKMKEHNLYHEKIPGKIKILLKHNKILDILTNITNLKKKPEIYK